MCERERELAVGGVAPPHTHLSPPLSLSLSRSQNTNTHTHTHTHTHTQTYSLSHTQRTHRGREKTYSTSTLRMRTAAREKGCRLPGRASPSAGSHADPKRRHGSFVWAGKPNAPRQCLRRRRRESHDASHTARGTRHLRWEGVQRRGRVPPLLPECGVNLLRMWRARSALSYRSPMSAVCSHLWTHR